MRFGALGSRGGFGGMGASLGRGGNSASMRQVGTRTHVFSSLNAYTSSMSRVWDTSPIDVTALEITLCNWYVRQSDGAEVGPGGPTTFAVAVEYPAGVFTQMTMAGNATPLIADGGEAVFTCNVNIPKNATRWYRIYMANAGGNMMNVNFANSYDPSRGDAFTFNGPDQTMGGTLDDNGSSSFCVFPAMVRAMSNLPVWVAFGDSTCNGVNDTIPDATGATGWFGRGLSLKGPYVNLGCSGDQMTWFVSNSAKRRSLATRAGMNFAINGYGINDIVQGRLQAQLEADRATFQTLLSGTPVYNITIPPQTVGGPTAAGQTSDATKTARRIAYNTSARAGISGSAGLIDIASLIEADTTHELNLVVNGGVWLPRAWGDGTHPSTAGYKMVTPLLTALGSPQVLAPQAGFNWPFGTYPLTISATGLYTAKTDFVPESYMAAALAGPQYWVDVSAAGSDANPGTQASPVKSIWKATQLANAAGVPARVMVKWNALGYGRANGFTNTSTPVPNTVPIAYIGYGVDYPAQGGIIDCWVGDGLTWSGTPDPTFTTLYTATRAAVSQVINPTILDANGDPIMATKYADAATANAASGSAWAQVGSTLYVKWAGGAAVTNNNTRAMLQSTPNFVQNATSKDVYVKGFNFYGGAAGAMACTAAATMNMMFVNCNAAYAGDAATNVNGWKIDFVTGLVALVNCKGFAAEADGINTHWTPGGTPLCYTLTIGCQGYNNGRDTVQSCNGITSHDNCIGIDVMGEYFGNFGANVIPINGNQMWCVGTYAHDSVGDVGHGGSTTPTDFQTQATAVMWLQNCRSAVSATSLLASNTSTIKTRNFLPGVGQSPGAGGGTITTF